MKFVKYTSGMVLPFGDTIAIDCETDSLNERQANLSCMVIADDRMGIAVDSVHLSEVMPFIKSRKMLYLQNFKYDYQVLSHHGFNLSEIPFRDTMLLHHLIDENAEHSLDAMVKEHFNDAYKEVFWKTYKSFSDAPLDEATDYVCKDGIYTYRLATKFCTTLAGREKLVNLVHDIALELFQTELVGVRVDKELMLKTKEEMGTRITDFMPAMRKQFEVYCEIWEEENLQKKLNSLKKQDAKNRALANKEKFNFGSDSQIKWLVYDALKLPVLKRTAKKNPACDYDTIEKLEQEEPRLGIIKDYKEIKTIYATFVEGLLEKVEEGRLYPRFNINGTVTGRISSSGPNMQNMPKEGIIRNFFLPDEGHLLIGADYAQLEVVIAANMSGDTMLTKSIMEGISLHDITAEGVGITRDLAKLLNFAVQYGAGEHKVAKILKCSKEDARGILKKYWETYSGLKTLVDRCHKAVDDGEPIVNPFGRQRHFPTEFEQKWQYEEAKRQAFNSLVQGTGADITHTAFSDISQYLRTNQLGRGLWPVHDELVISVIKNRAGHAWHLLKRSMEVVGENLNFQIPLTAKIYGPLERWSKA